jgi:hypothetical protein
MVLSVEDIASVDAAYWANLRQIKLQKGVWSFKDRQYLLKPMQSKARRKCYMKATQGGFTELEVNGSLHGLIYKRYPRGVLYLFPTTDDVREFSKARFGPLISSNPSSIGKFVQDTDTASLKRVGDAFLYLRGATLSRQIEIDSRESTKLRGISVDKVVFDELDLMDEDARAKALGRMGDSTVQEEVYISNPTLPSFGIAAIFEMSDQGHWFRQCGCGGWTCAELSFPDLVGVKDGRGYIACVKCGKPVANEPGEWVPAMPQNSAYMEGYQWSQLSSVNNDPYEILQQYQDPPGGNLGDVVRLRLGRPHISAQDRLTVQAVLSCCGDQPQLDSHPGPCAMGVDIRQHKNVVVGIRTGRERYQVLRVARVTSWEEVKAIHRRFHVKSCIVDIRPYEDSARQFQKDVRGQGKTYLCEYSESTPVGTMYNDKTGIVKVNRTEICDATHRLISSERMLELPAICPEVKQFAIECSSVAKVEQIDRKTKAAVFRYRCLSTNPDDYRHALNYFYLAASGHKIGVVDGRERRRSRQAKNEYVRC